jgi:hypothetical protein
MKKKYIYTTLLAFIFLCLCAIFLKYQHNEAASYDLLERKGVVGDSREWQLTRTYATSLLAALKKNPSDTKSALALAALFIQEARVTGNYVYMTRPP